MTDIERIKSKSNYPQALKQLQPERISDESNMVEIGAYLSENSVNCSREVVVKIIDKIKKL
jgi:hypothetical protein